MTAKKPDPKRRSGDPLAVLECIDRLTVGPVRLEPRRLTMPYVVEQGDRRAEHELIYRYEQDVFDPDSPASRNLANLIGAQVALNYGLFCREIAFVGEFDRRAQARRGLAELRARIGSTVPPRLSPEEVGDAQVNPGGRHVGPCVPELLECIAKDRCGMVAEMRAAGKPDRSLRERGPAALAGIKFIDIPRLCCLGFAPGPVEHESRRHEGTGQQHASLHPRR